MIPWLAKRLQHIELLIVLYYSTVDNIFCVNCLSGFQDVEQLCTYNKTHENTVIDNNIQPPRCDGKSIVI